MTAFINGIGNISAQATFGSRAFPEEWDTSAAESRRVIAPDYKAYIEPRLLRRMSKILRMGVTAARAAMQDAKVELPEAIVTATALGCTQDTHRFLKDLIERDEQALAPTSFIQSTHNTIGGQIALQLQLNGYNMTYTQRGSSFESAVLDALLLLDSETVAEAVVGAVDELIDPVEVLQRRLGLYRHLPETPTGLIRGDVRGSIGGEGSTFFVLSNQPANPYARLRDVETMLNPSDDLLAAGLQALLHRNGLEAADIDVVISGRSGDARGDGMYDQFLQKQFPTTPEAVFKPFCGEYQSASAFATWLAALSIFHGRIPDNFVRRGAPEKLERVLIYNHFQRRNHNFLLLTR